MPENAPGVTRTRNIPLRRRALYPLEVRAHVWRVGAPSNTLHCSIERTPCQIAAWGLPSSGQGLQVLEIGRRHKVRQDIDDDGANEDRYRDESGAELGIQPFLGSVDQGGRAGR